MGNASVNPDGPQDRPPTGAEESPRARPSARADEGAGAPDRSKSRLLGFDRSGPPPSETVAGSPLHPWTPANAVGFLRLALIPAFLVVALSSADGTDPLAVTLFAVAGWGDYADGITARITGQYSRLGALMDPVTDRLLVVAGVVVCWRFDLLPHWALAVLAAREIAMLVLSRYGLRHGVDVKINWPGRLAVPPVMGSLFFAMAGLGTLGEILLYLGLAMALLATALYVRDGLRIRRAQRGTGTGTGTAAGGAGP